MKQRTLLCTVAHPDDETFGAGGLLLHAVSQGARVVTVCATRGEAGEIMERSGATAETLPAVREQEYREAGRILGVSESILLGYIDSGMPGAPENDNPAAFIQQPKEQVVRDIMRIIDRVQPDVVVTMDAGGGYGHPDHIFITECAVSAFHRAREAGTGSGGDPAKLYMTVFPRSRLKAAWERMSLEDPDSPLAQIDPETVGVPDEEVTLELHFPGHERTLREAFAAHRSQISPLERIPDDLATDLLHHAWLSRAFPAPVKGDESDIFNGL